MSTPLELLLLLSLVLAPTLGPRAVDEPQAETKTELSAEQLGHARETLKQFAKQLRDAKFLAADYRQVRETFLFGTPIVSKGHIRLRREPACLRMDVSEPKVAIIRSDATSHLTWHAGKDRAERLVFDSNETAVMLVRLLTGDVADLEKLFVIERFETVEGVTRIGLAPRDEQLAKQLTRLDLLLDAKTSMPVAVEHENADGEKVRIELTEPSLTEELEDSGRIFDSPLPEGIRIVTRRIETPK